MLVLAGEEFGSLVESGDLSACCLVVVIKKKCEWNIFKVDRKLFARLSLVSSPNCDGYQRR